MYVLKNGTDYMVADGFLTIHRRDAVRIPDDVARAMRDGNWLRADSTRTGGIRFVHLKDRPSRAFPSWYDRETYLGDF